MITLTDTQLGIKRKAIWGGLNSFDLLTSDSLNMVYYVQLIDGQGDLLNDKSLNQNRKVVYSIGKVKRVNQNFQIINEGDTGYETAKTEFQYFAEMANTVALPTLAIQLGNVLKQRGIFE